MNHALWNEVMYRDMPNPCRAEYILIKCEYIAFSNIPQYWNDADFFKPYLCKMRPHLSCINTMVADGLAKQGARASAAMVLT